MNGTLTRAGGLDLRYYLEPIIRFMDQAPQKLFGRLCPFSRNRRTQKTKPILKILIFDVRNIDLKIAIIRKFKENHSKYWKNVEVLKNMSQNIENRKIFFKMSKIEKFKILTVRNSGESGLSATSTSSPGAGCDAGHPQWLPQRVKV